MTDINEAIRLYPKGSSLFQTHAPSIWRKHDYEHAIATPTRAFASTRTNPSAYRGEVSRTWERRLREGDCRRDESARMQFGVQIAYGSRARAIWK